MALIQCPKCGQQISDRANKCPHCGYVINPSNFETSDIKPTKSKKSIWVWCVGILILIGVGVGVFLYSSPKTDKAIDSEQTEIAQQTEEVKITPEFSEKVSKYLKVEEFSDGRAAVLTDEYKWGYIDVNGDLVIPAIYGFSSASKFNNGYVLAVTDDKKAYIDTDGKEIIHFAKDDIVSNLVNGKTVVYSAQQNGWECTLVGDRFRVYNMQGEIISEIPIPDDNNLIGYGPWDIEEAFPVSLTDKGFIVPMNNGNNRLYDFNGNYSEVVEAENNNDINPSKYDYIVFEEEQNDYGEGTPVSLRGIKDKQGNIIVSAKEWRFPMATFDSETKKYYINPSQGLFLAVLEESPDYLKNIENNRVEDESTEASYYGYVNLKGENTFSEERWERQRIQTYNILNNITIHLGD